MSIKEDFEKNQVKKTKGKPRDIGDGIIKVEIKNGHIEASSRLNVPKETLVMVLIILESLQRAMVENDTKIQSILKNLRRISDKELVQLVKENAEILEAGTDAGNID
ncbi:MAG: hypothetical protein Q4C11_00275 [Clostridium sp.]|nr:hypothetical protein [Clostridium sp.]